MSDARLIVVSNRLPVTLKKEDGEWQASRSSGGLASAMGPILQKCGGIWIGSSGEEEAIDPDARERLMNEPGASYRLVPVDMPPELASQFYEGYPNRVIWPLFHLFPSRMAFTPEAWSAYQEGNRYFCECVLREYRPGDLLWVHDYHLMLLPAMLRRKIPDARIGFFLHIPFPASQLAAMLPRSDELLGGLLDADLLAFHTYSHLHHFRSALLRVLALDSGLDHVDFEGRTISLSAMPIGIAPEQLTSVMAGAEFAAYQAELARQYHGQQVIIAVDRMDYTKGIPERLKAYRRLLVGRTELAGRVTLIQVAVPSRENIDTYQDLRGEVNQLVGEINGKLGTSGWTPVVYINRGISVPELTALYSRADVAWVTPLQDGMNLVAKEYCACKPDGNGVLVLSAFAGAAAELGEALIVNPYDDERMAEAVDRALSMSRDERRPRMRALNARVMRRTVYRWAEEFMSELSRTATHAEEAKPQPLRADELAAAYDRASKRLVLLDYDGTLTEFSDRPEAVAPKRGLLEIFQALSADPANRVALISGRRADQLEAWFGGIDGLILAAEHGAKTRDPYEAQWRNLRDAPNAAEWKDKVRPILEHFTDRTPGSFVEEKEFSLAWHYRRVEPEFGEWLAGELTELLGGMLADTNARTVRGHKVVEVRPAWATKGELTSWLLAQTPNADFRLAAGDDRTDEDMFARMPAGSWTIHVGDGASRAAYRVWGPAAMLDVLTRLCLVRAA
jgi:trehalose 6-phosphate synthase/phosphatase